MTNWYGKTAAIENEKTTFLIFMMAQCQYGAYSTCSGQLEPLRPFQISLMSWSKLLKMSYQNHYFVKMTKQFF